MNDWTPYFGLTRVSKAVNERMARGSHFSMKGIRTEFEHEVLQNRGFTSGAMKNVSLIQCMHIPRFRLACARINIAQGKRVQKRT